MSADQASRPARVLMLGWEFPPRIAGGLGTACFGLTRALDRLGHPVTFVMPGPPGDGIARAHPGFTSAGFMTVGSAPSGAYSTYAYGPDLVMESQRFASLACAAALPDFDVIHAHDWPTFPAGMLLASLTGRPLVVHVHSTEQDRSAGRPVGAPGRAAADIEGAAARCAARVIAVSGVIARACVERYGADPSRVVVVHNGTDGRIRRPASMRRGGEEERCVLFMARLSPQKGPALFLLAAREALRRALRPPRFVMAGDGEERTPMERLAADLGIAGRVEFPGFLRGRAVGEAYSGADLFVMTSLAEPFGLTVMEAVMHGLPVIVPPWAGVTEVLPSAITCDPGDAGSLGGAIVALLEDPGRSELLVRRTQAEAERRPWRAAAEQCAEVYRGLRAAKETDAALRGAASARFG